LGLGKLTLSMFLDRALVLGGVLYLYFPFGLRDAIVDINPV
jgi:hypothetical protein